MTIYFFPTLFDRFGVPVATVMVSVIPLIGYLAATFVLPEVYGHVESDTTASPEPQPA